MTTASTHVVLGGNGVIGRETLRALIGLGVPAASVGRRPAGVDQVRSITADLLDPAAVERAVAGAEVAYLTAGLPYSARVWANQWPVIVRNAIDAAIAHGTHLVYFDNVYAYGRVDGPMTERTPVDPSSRKGRVRAAALDLLDRAVAERGLVRTVGRSADFYGPGATTSVFNTYALDRITAGKAGIWLFDSDQPHSMSYTPDMGAALAILGTDPAARGHVWHLPTAPALTGRQYLELAGGPGRTMTAGTIRLGALFDGGARETLEMGYQYTAPYLFDSTAFETAFSMTPTPTADGIAASLGAVRAAG
ncbi:NAD-dependent epimerase [Actinocatenispora thailandica]|uniref:NAD-dependent epimerase n=1 Tax=Actinocatenispora thailandica TaxID=227318 RepID=A0A7R7DPZ2_9ACTN|nr:NAD-dependent epimerase/dehydratase family protein [Actinocatenispora thailandica]BCJ35654.1 NAD-dependent epimerase [Actinocatenispora thailandica]